MKHITTVALLIAAVIHLLPLAGVLGAAKLSSLYGIDIANPDLVILMRHRAVLFGLLGAYMLYAVFAPQHRAVALVAGLVSVVSFLALAHGAGSYNASIGRVVVADWIALAALVAGSVANALGARAA